MEENFFQLNKLLLDLKENLFYPLLLTRPDNLIWNYVVESWYIFNYTEYLFLHNFFFTFILIFLKQSRRPWFSLVISGIIQTHGPHCNHSWSMDSSIYALRRLRKSLFNLLKIGSTQHMLATKTLHLCLRRYWIIRKFFKHEIPHLSSWNISMLLRSGFLQLK